MFTLHNGDCLEYMKSLAPESIQAVITDPPYGINYDPSFDKWDGSASNYEKIIGDDKPFDPAPFLKFAPFVCLFGANYFSDKLPLGGWIIWDKRTKEHLDKMIGKSGEIAWCNIEGEIFIIRALHGGVVNLDSMNGNNEPRYHPTQKPVTVMKRIIEKYTQPNDIIFDPFMGSGSTGVACVQSGRRFIGCEISPKYYSIAEKRLKLAVQSPSFFTPSNNRLQPTAFGVGTQAQFSLLGGTQAEESSATHGGG